MGLPQRLPVLGAGQSGLLRLIFVCVIQLFAAGLFAQNPGGLSLPEASELEAKIKASVF